MANNDQDESGLPVTGNEPRKTSNLLPRTYRTDSNKKFLQATLDQLVQPGKVKKLNGFIGQKNAKSTKSDDIYIDASDKSRSDYQLEPAAVIQDKFENVTFYKDYIDHINQIDVLGGNVVNHERLNKQEFYSWNPHIDWDKFVNFQNYYWLPYGPDVIKVFGQQEEIDSTYTVNLVDEGDNYAFLFTPNGLTRNPTLRLFRGQTYNFSVNSPGNPFSIKTTRVAGDIDRYKKGVSDFAVEDGVITFKVRADAPDLLYYVNEKDPNAGGVFQILDIEENTFLDVDKDILGKKDYTLNSGVKVSNGMKLNFEGNVTPEKYAQGNWYVDGVGQAITLIPESELEIIGTYTQESELLFDDTGFDQDPFSVASAFPRDKDYILVKKGAKDRNPWSRYNRWFHYDVIRVSAEANNKVPEFDQSSRAVRPIIEFDADLKLYNFGHVAKKDVDLIDTFTTDVFSTIEGSVGYNIDGIDLVNGMRVLFSADTDRLVRGRIFKVNFINISIPQRQIEFLANSTKVNATTDVITFDTEHGLNTGTQVTYLNNGNNSINGLTHRQQYYVYVVDSLQIKLYNDSELTKKTDIFKAGENTHKFEVFSGVRRQINLVEEPDTLPLQYETVLVKNGVQSKGYMYWYDGSNWKLGPVKTAINQAPLFDIFDSNGNSYSDTSVYDGSTFTGNKIFSYKVGTGANDSVLGFPLSYKNINNVGDIVFSFDLLQDSFNYKDSISVLSKKTDVGYLRKISTLDTWSYANGWEKSNIVNVQPVVRIFKESGLVNNFPVDVYDNQNDLADLEVRVYINGKRLNREEYTLERGVVRYVVVLDNDAALTDVVTLRCFASQAKNENGHYEIPISLQNNPLNKNLTTFTLGEVVDHVNSIVDNITDFRGNYPGIGNLRDLGDLTSYGTRIVQHSAPLNAALYHLGKPEINVVKALIQAQEDYATFKRTFLITAGKTGVELDARRHVDIVLDMMLKDKPKTYPYYLSDMFGYLGSVRLEYLVEDSRFQRIFSIPESFSLKTLSKKAVYVYRNGEQLIEGTDYVFGDEDVFFRVIGDLNDDDIIEVYYYESTDGSFCPPTPTKLGLYPKYQPKKFIDDTYLEPREVIQGHDGSITLGFGDYRDDLLLELELRIYNNIKTEYNSQIFDIWNFIPGYNRKTEYSKQEFETALSPSFFQWTNIINEDYTKQTYWDRLEPFTFNYRGNYFPDGTDSPAFWRGIYHWLFDTDRPHTHPWECLGFSVKPTWWEDLYGIAPYTKDNQVLWEDISQGVIREPGKPPRYNLKFAKPILATGAPTDELGNLISPLDTNFVSGPLPSTAEGYYTFGDRGPVETAWRRSSYYPFALIKTILLLNPNKVFATCFDRNRQVKNLTDQLIYSPTGLRLKLSDIVLPSTVNDTQRVYASGLINYIVDYAFSDITFKIDEYKEDLQLLTNKIAYRLGGFTSKSKFNILLDSKNPTSSGGVFVPEDNFNVFLNVSTPIRKLAYSGVIISKYADGFEIRGYNVDEPYFVYYPYRQNDRIIRIGGISESYTTWAAGKTYIAGKVVLFGNVYYRVKVSHQSEETFDESLYARLPGLPIVGGKEAILRKGWDKRQKLFLAYGTKLATIQEVVDFIQGYGVYLEEQGFVFDQYNANLKSISNWETSINEFLFWTTQGWSEGSAISLSPSASKLVVSSDKAVVDDIRNSFYGYKVFRVDGQLLAGDFANTFRENNQFALSPNNTSHGIYGAIFYLVQKEHILLLDNTTLFNDVIYDQEPGYRQERVKVIGYITTNWNGGFDIPGFIYDQAKIKDYEPWTDYNLGDIVKYKEYYYSAMKFIVGSQDFNSEDWYLLDEKPTPQLLPNWDYRAEQFTDFYDLDTDNFDSEQQRLAQHLIGYQNRQYLENIIKDDVSQYKFYQGMIIEKGTQNVLNKLFDVLSADDQESLTFNEEWAVRVGEYGATNTFQEIEFKLDEANFKLNPQPVLLVNEIATNTDLIYRIRAGEVYVKPLGYNNNPWPTTGVKKFLRDPGYVRYENVKLNVNTLPDALSTDISEFKEGDYVWAAFEGRNWNVYRFTKNTFLIQDVEYTNGTLSLQCDRIPNLSVGDTIGIENSEKIKGFYTIDSIAANKIFIKTVIKEWTPPFVDSSQILTYRFISSRIDSIDEANTKLPPYIKNDELLWADNNGQGAWSVYSNKKVYSRSLFANNAPRSNLNFGSKVVVSKNGRFASVSTLQNEVYIFEKNTAVDEWIEIQYITPDLDVASQLNLSFGSEVAFSEDAKWLAVAAPTASNIKSDWRGEFVVSNTYAFGDVVQVRNTHFSARKGYFGDGSSIDRFSQDWAPCYLVNVQPSKPVYFSNINQGYVNIYEKTPGGRYNLKHSIVSPNPTANELFGSKMTFAKNGNEYVLAITSAGYNENQGRVYMFRYAELEEDSTQTAWHMDYRRTYQGTFSAVKQYYPGDIVFYNYELYQCITEQDPNSFETNASGWQVMDDTSILGFFPQEVISNVSNTDLVVSPTREQNVESVLPGDLFGYDVKMSGDGNKLIISAPNSDQNTYTNFKGKFRSSERYDLNDVVYYNGGLVNSGTLQPGQTYELSQELNTSLGSTNWVSLGLTPTASFEASIRGNTTLFVWPNNFSGRIRTKESESTPSTTDVELSTRLVAPDLTTPAGGIEIIEGRRFTITSIIKSSSSFIVNFTPALIGFANFPSGIQVRISGATNSNFDGTWTSVNNNSNSSFIVQATISGSNATAGGEVNAGLGGPGYYTISTPIVYTPLFSAYTVVNQGSFVSTGTGTGDGSCFLSAGYYRYTRSFDSSVAGTFAPSDWQFVSSTRNNNTGKVFVYEYDGDAYLLVDTLGAQNLNLELEDRFGESIAISNSGNTLAVGMTGYSDTRGNQGAVVVCESYSGTFSPYQTLVSVYPGTNDKFGQFVDFMNDDQTLVVFSPNGNIKNETSFDNFTTTFDNSTLRVIDLQIDSGRIDIFDKYANNYIYGESLTTEPTNSNVDGYGTSITVGKNVIIASAPKEVDQEYSNSGIVYAYKKKNSTKSWTVLHYERPRANAYKIKKAFLYNRKENVLIKYLDIVDPIQGKIPGPADQEIKFKTYFDPATYTVGSSSVNVDDGMAWTSTYVGMLWWDLTNARFLDNQGGEPVYRSTTWNTLYETASIDIYEWVETKYLPSEWDKLADTEKGAGLGISGTSKYGDSVYSIKKKYDTVSKTFINTYYFWVKNKNLLPNKEGRLLAASSVARLIADPVSYGYPCLVLLGSDSFSLVNCDSYLEDKDTVLNVQVWASDDIENNAHTQWKIISEHPNTVIPYEIEQKWLDSLLGKDKHGRVVPDLRLPFKQRYGIENRPRQGMFINRVEALKQFIERVNSVLKANLIVDEFDLTTISQFEPPPSVISGLWDVQIDTDPELRFVGTSLLRKARFAPIIEDGKIIDVDILDSGRGYVNAPSIKAAGKGKNAELKAVLDEFGQVVDVEIINQGIGYKDDTILSIRAFTVLVLSDSDSYDKWSLYTWNTDERVWEKTRTQTYDVTRFWDYIDWYTTGYDQFTKVTYVVDNTYQLATLESAIGDTVKVSNVGTGGWLLLEKYDNITTIDYTQNYKVIGRQNGTIKFLDTLYNFKSQSLGFDGPLFDSEQYDAVPTTELSIILDAIKNKILIDNLKVEYLKLFFSSVRYAMSEQPFVDWIMKTSFVKATHHAGNLKQKINYNSDNLQDFESYVAEVKPFRTKVREYISSYDRIENAGMSVTDFDLPPVIDEDFAINPLKVLLDENYSIGSSYSQLLEYPWKHWYDNASYSIDYLELVDGGAGYIDPPQVKIVDDYGIVVSSNELKSNFDASTSTWTLNEGTMRFQAAGLPYHSYEEPTAENQPQEQNYNQVIPLRGGAYQAGVHVEVPLGVIGYCLNGVAIFNPSAGESAPDGLDPVTGYSFVATPSAGEQFGYSFGQDVAGGLATEDGTYYYTEYSFREAWISGTGNSLGDINRSEVQEIPYYRDGLDHANGHSKIIGFALDGYPIYGPYGYSVATDPTSSVVRMVSGYELKLPSYRIGLVSDLNTYPMGMFIEDYEFIGNGTLDRHNGRYCITPDYPNGTYAYFVTVSSAGTPVYPYVLGDTYYGDPAPQDRNDATDGKGTRPRTYSIFNSNAVLATAKAYITNGKVSRLVLQTNGSGYLKTPRVVFEGGLSDTGTVKPASAVAVLKSNAVRSNKIVVKFDRITRNYFVTEISHTESFTGSGSRKQFNLRFSPVATIGNSTVTVNGVEVLRDDYKLSTKTSVTKGYTSYYGLLTFETAPALGAVIEITYDKNFEHLSAADRINFYYNPVTGQLGKDLAQLMTGIDYGGVIVTGLGLSIDGGWDSQPWFTEGWDGYDVGFDDYIVSVSDSTYVFTLPYIPEDGEQINVYVNGTRIDDEYFDSYNGVTVQPNGRTSAPAGRVMQTWVGDGLTNIIELPNLTNDPALDINAGDRIIFRKSTSDGSIAADPKSYDTQLQGGSFSYSSATGFAPDDILVEGGSRFVTPDTSHAPEEIVPGHITDTLNIKVFRVPRSGSSTILFKNYICDGVTTQFDIGQFPNNAVGLFVKLDNLILTKDTDYTVNWQDRTIEMTVAPLDGKILNVISFGAASENVLDVNYFVSDGSTVEFITNAPWPALAVDDSIEDTINRLGTVVFVNNEPAEYELFRTDESYDTTGFVGIRFADPVEADSVINYIINADANQSISVIKSQTLTVDGSTATFQLENQVGNSQPYENSIIVIQNGQILKPGESMYWTLSNNEYVYNIPDYKALPFTLSPPDIKVYVNGIQLSVLDYTLDVGALTVSIRDYAYVEGGTLTLTRYNNQDSAVTIDNPDYYISGGNIIFDDIPTGNVEVVTMYNHDVQNITRTREYFNITSTLVPGSPTYYQYQKIRGGSLKLVRSVKSDDYIWVSKNRQLLSHSVDFYLDDDLRTIKFKTPFGESDIIDVILFSDNNVTNGFGFMQFKDMLNRTHYKRINKFKSTRLAKELTQRDTTITVENGDVLTEPNRSINLPGIIEINGERIEYFVKNGNVLSQLRRATLGTGAPAMHKGTSVVLDIGSTETIPYKDEFVVESTIGDGSTNNIELAYAPTKVETDWYTETIPENYGRSDEIEVFVGGVRLRKNSYTLFKESNEYPDSPEGDSQFEAEFSVKGTNEVRLTNDVAENVKITVIKKIGRVWEDAAPPQRIFKNIPIGSGAATVDVVKNGNSYAVSLVKGGTGYAVGNNLIILGTRVGGQTPENDITITVTDVTDDSTASIIGFTYAGIGADSGYTTVSLSDSENPIANFLKDTEAVWPQYLVDKYEYVLLTESGEEITVDGDEPLELD